MKINVREPYKTAILISIATSVILGAAYLAIGNKNRGKLNSFIKNKLKLKKDEREMAETTDVR